MKINKYIFNNQKTKTVKHYYFLEIKSMYFLVKECYFVLPNELLN